MVKSKYKFFKVQSYRLVQICNKLFFKRALNFQITSRLDIKKKHQCETNIEVKIDFIQNLKCDFRYKKYIEFYILFNNLGTLFQKYNGSGLVIVEIC